MYNSHYIQPVLDTNVNKNSFIIHWAEIVLTNTENILNVRPEMLLLYLLYATKWKELQKLCSIFDFYKTNNMAQSSLKTDLCGHLCAYWYLAYRYVVCLYSIDSLCVSVPGVPLGAARPCRPPGCPGASVQQRHQQSQHWPAYFHL